MKSAICAPVYMQGTLKKALVFLSLLGLVGIASLLVNLNSMPVHAQGVKAKGYLPLAHLMNDAMQIHHTKLWFSGNAKNWALAAYELKKIKDTIEEVKESIVDLQNSSPEWRRLPIGEILTSFDSNLRSLDQAIKAKDAVRFDSSYSELTGTCNACHVSAGQPQIKIVKPLLSGSSTFADQDFTTDSGQQQ
ncbi:MAG: hypothetical protein WA322_00350 [Pseudolabrys sp.]